MPILPVEGYEIPTQQPRPILPVEPPMYDVQRVNGVTQIKSAAPVLDFVGTLAGALESAGIKANDMGKQFAQYDRELTDDVLTLAKNLLTNPDEKFKKQRKQAWDILTGQNGNERVETWPEKMVRSGTTLPGDVLSGKEPLFDEDGKIAPRVIERAMDTAGFAGTGGLVGAGAGGVALGSTPLLRPALKYKDRLYKGKEGQQHLDVLPRDLQGEFTRQAMSGEDISNFNFGFVNHKGQFLDREKALQYAVENGIVDQHAAKYGALTSTLLADSTKPGVAIEALKNSKPFYSAVEHTVNAIPQAKMTGDQWLGTLSNKPGVKAEELQWTGLSDFLAEKKGQPVTKAEIQEFVAANKVELNEVRKGAREAPSSAEELAKLQSLEKRFAEGDRTLNANDAADLAELRMASKQQEMATSPSKYSKWQLPGGENYREMLLTLPTDKPVNFSTYAKDKFGYTDEQIKNGFNNFKDKAFAEWEARQSKIEQSYKSSHWDEPNILAHVRMNDRTIDGKKSLHLEEIQSDWHQQGRDKGYRPEQEKKLAELVKQRDDMIKNNPEKIDELNNLHDQIREIGISDVGVPDAPFKKSWHELALKRMLREAAEKGYDRLSWTPGEAQAARYDLSKQVDSIKVDNNIVRINPNNGSAINLQIDNAGKVTSSFPSSQAGQFEGKHLSDVVGKEIAEKIIKDKSEGAKNWGVKNKASGNWSQRFASKEEAAKYQAELPENIRGKTEVLEMVPKTTKTYEGLDLKIGGEGMKGFYDQIIPKSIEKLGKEFGVKVNKSFAETGNYILPEGGMISPDKMNLLSETQKKSLKPEGNHVFYIDIPQGLKDTAMRKGFPLFSAGVPYPLIPVDGNPFEK